MKKDNTAAFVCFVIAVTLITYALATRPIKT
jgi:hypothetical protein